MSPPAHSLRVPREGRQPSRGVSPRSVSESIDVLRVTPEMNAAMRPPLHIPGAQVGWKDAFKPGDLRGAPAGTHFPSVLAKLPRPLGKHASRRRNGTADLCAEAGVRREALPRLAAAARAGDRARGGRERARLA